MTSLYFLADNGTCYASNAYGDKNQVSSGTVTFGSDYLTPISLSGCVFSGSHKGNPIKNVTNTSGLMQIIYDPNSGFSFNPVQPSSKVPWLSISIILVLIVIAVIAYFSLRNVNKIEK